MADITMCANEDCPKRETCYRATADRNEYWQAWSKFGPDESGECPWYLSRTGDEKEAQR